jgi:hypothetical protein
MAKRVVWEFIDEKYISQSIFGDAIPRGLDQVDDGLP